MIDWFEIDLFMHVSLRLPAPIVCVPFAWIRSIANVITTSLGTSECTTQLEIPTRFSYNRIPIAAPNNLFNSLSRTNVAKWCKWFRSDKGSTAAAHYLCITKDR